MGSEKGKILSFYVLVLNNPCANREKNVDWTRFLSKRIYSKCPHATHAKEYLNNHKKRMHAKGEFVCQECKKAFTKEGLLINHVCGSENDHFKCPKCEFEHTQKYFMTHYKKVHGGIPPGMCSFIYYSRAKPEIYCYDRVDLQFCFSFDENPYFWSILQY